MLKRLDRIIELMEKPPRPKRAVSSRVGSAGKLLPKTSQAPEPVPTPSKSELVRQWFRDHPEDLGKTGRELETLRPMGVKITYKTWNDVKKEMKE